MRRNRRSSRAVTARGFECVALVVAGCLLAAAAAPQETVVAGAAGDAPLAERQAANLETFDAAWDLIRRSHFDPEFNGVDWGQVREELRSKAGRAASEAELRAVIREMLDRLGQSHFALLRGTAGGRQPAPSDGPEGTELRETVGEPSECDPDFRQNLNAMMASDGFSRLAAAGPGIDVRLVGGEVVVVRVEAGGPAAEGGVKPGWGITRLAGHAMGQLGSCLGRDVDDASLGYLARSLVLGLLSGPVGSPVAVEFEVEEGRSITIDLLRAEPPGKVARFGNLPPVPAHLTAFWLDEPGDVRIGVIRFNLWMVPIVRLFDEAMEEMRTADGLVIDLRGNLGGVAPVAQGIAGHFFEERLSMGTLKSRRDELELFVNPRLVNRSGQRVKPFAGPLAVLIDGLSASTSEVFAAGLRDLGRARLFGQPSAGAALPAAMDRLPNGDVLMHATADFIRPNGERIEGRPLIPDEIVPLDAESLLAGSDEPLLAAARWLEHQIGFLAELNNADAMTTVEARQP